VHRLPFALHLYNQAYKNIAVGSNGNIQPGITAPGGVAGAQPWSCLPTTVFGGKPSISVFWHPDGLGYIGAGKGIFTRTTGTAPHRTFRISWQGFIEVTAPTMVNAQAVFTEGSQTVTFLYGATNAQIFVVLGMQSKQQLSSTQVHCNGTVFDPTGLKVTFTHFD
jgi:hypothetical protein